QLAGAALNRETTLSYSTGTMDPPTSAGKYASASQEAAAARTSLKDELVGAEEVVQLSIFGDETPPKKAKPAAEDPGARQIINMLKSADLMNMTPLQAMQLVNELKMKAKDM
ncbi:DNA mismatch repair protein MutS, partial [Paenibacillus macerans]|nr:DNA mismatch repair protein MutS [Paenibacillus macerans]